MKTRSRKNKGARLQKWVANKISEITGIPVKKDGDIESRQMGQSGTDVILRGNALHWFPFSIECQNAEKWDVHGKIKQAKTNRKKETSWLCFFKRNREKPIVVLDAEVFFEIYEELIKWRKRV